MSETDEFRQRLAAPGGPDAERERRLLERRAQVFRSSMTWDEFAPIEGLTDAQQDVFLQTIDEA